VIELLQQQMDESRLEAEKQLELAKAALATEMTLGHELDLDALRTELSGQMQQRAVEVRQLTEQIDSKNGELERLRRTLDRFRGVELMLSLFKNIQTVLASPPRL